MTRVSEPDGNYDIQLAEGLSPEQRDEALRIFAGLRASRGIRDGHQGSPGVPVPLCPVPGGCSGHAVHGRILNDRWVRPRRAARRRVGRR
jgi:hypothetical protein